MNIWKEGVKLVKKVGLGKGSMKRKGVGANKKQVVKKEVEKDCPVKKRGQEEGA